MLNPDRNLFIRFKTLRKIVKMRFLVNLQFVKFDLFLVEAGRPHADAGTFPFVTADDSIRHSVRPLVTRTVSLTRRFTLPIV